MNLHRRDFLKNTALAGADLLAASSRSPTSAAGNNRPNVVLILCDDFRWDALHIFGNDTIETANIDRLAARGSIFRRATCAYPICVVSRTELLSGRCLVGAHAGKCGWYAATPFDLSWTLWPELLERSGWHTICSGKWDVVGSPGKDGFSETAGLYSSGGGPKCFNTISIDANGHRVTGYRGWTFKTPENRPLPALGVGLTPDTDVHIADRVIDAIRRNANRPYFLEVNFTSPHDPRLWPRGMENRVDFRQVTLPPNFRPQHPFTTGDLDGRDELFIPAPRNKESVRRELAVYLTCLENIDKQVGRIVRALEKTGALSRTLIIFAADHGLAIGSHGLMGKQNQYEHTINVPLILAGPGIPAGKAIEAQCYLRDLYPTFCELAGLIVPPSVQGRSLLPVLRGEKPDVHEAVFGYFADVQRMIRDRDGWKLIWYPAIDRYQLFHVPEDPFEIRDLAGDPEQHNRMQRMKMQLEKWQHDYHDPLLVCGRGAASF